MRVDAVIFIVVLVRDGQSFGHSNVRTEIPPMFYRTSSPSGKIGCLISVKGKEDISSQSRENKAHKANDVSS